MMNPIEAEPNSPSRGQKHICLFFESEEFYKACLEDLTKYRAHLTKEQQRHPELFPQAFAGGFTFHDSYHRRAASPLDLAGALARLKRLTLAAGSRASRLSGSGFLDDGRESFERRVTRALSFEEEPPGADAESLSRSCMRTAAAYREGATPLIALIDAQRARSEARGNYLKALFDYRNSLFTLEQVTGAEVN